ncbi:transposase-like protein [Labrenzia sp. EL_195]|nr:transposase-like protein [Labrenzia sp. EL_195]
MKRRFSEEQIIGILKEHEAGVSARELCRKHGMSDASLYNVTRQHLWVQIG